MAKKDKEKTKDKSKRKKAETPAAEPVAGEAGAANPASDMRRIAREAAWARMFGKNSARNPFAGRP